ncbi:MAG: MBL fold metallo-hydrolase [Myxococcales bacterium]|nr:MBL fold metallo-hydrolase [Myxococcales bacterium]
MWLALAWMGCADVTGIDRDRSSGRVVVLKDWFTSALLVKGEESVVLFDAGFRKGTMTRRLADHDLTPADITHVFVTHGHRDHLALLPELDASVHAFAEEAPLIEEELQEELTIDVPLEDGQVVQAGDVEVEVFAVPGHTAGSAVFLVDGVLVLGDAALQNRDEALIPVPEDRSEDPEQLVSSMRALAQRLQPRASEIDWLAPSHSAWMAGFEPLASF